MKDKWIQRRYIDTQTTETERRLIADIILGMIVHTGRQALDYGDFVYDWIFLILICENKKKQINVECQTCNQKSYRQTKWKNQAEENKKDRRADRIYTSAWLILTIALSLLPQHPSEDIWWGRWFLQVSPRLHVVRERMMARMWAPPSDRHDHAHVTFKRRLSNNTFRHHGLCVCQYLLLLDNFFLFLSYSRC